MSKPAWEDFGQEMNTLLNRIGVYCLEQDLTPEEVERIFNAGIHARAALFWTTTTTIRHKVLP